MFNLFQRNQRPDPQPKRTAQTWQQMQRVLNVASGAFQRMFDAAKPRMDALQWRSTLQHIDSVIATQQRPLVARSREAVVNSGVMSKFIKLKARNVVGASGIGLQVYSPNTDYNQAVEQAFALWGKQCEPQMRLSWRGVQELVQRSIDVDGEAFVLINETEKAFTLQVLDAQRIPPSLKHDKLKNGNSIMNGIEFSPLGVPVAYYYTTLAANKQAYNQYSSANDYLRLEAKDVLHIFRPEFVGQKRGLPSTKTALTNLYQLEQYTRSVLVNARTAANKTLLLKSEFPLYDAPTSTESTEEGPSTPQAPVLHSDEGNMLILPDGYSPVSHNPSYPTGEYVAFRKEMLKDSASALDVSYATVASDGEGVNFSTLRQFALDERDEYTVCQQLLIEHLCDPVYQRWLTWMFLHDPLKWQIPTTAYTALTNVQWLGRRWAWVDPLKDSVATLNKIKGMTQSFTQAAREQGRDPAELFAEIARDLEAMKQAGIPEAFIQRLYDVPVTVAIDPNTP